MAIELDWVQLEFKGAYVDEEAKAAFVKWYNEEMVRINTMMKEGHAEHDEVWKKYGRNDKLSQAGIYYRALDRNPLEALFIGFQAAWCLERGRRPF